MVFADCNFERALDGMMRAIYLNTGQVCHISPFDTEAEAIARANDTRYGLAATIWNDTVNRAHRVAEAMKAGLAWVNSWYLRDLRTPFGGSGLSSIGREGGMHSLNFYSELTNVCIRVEGDKP